MVQCLEMFPNELPPVREIILRRKLGSRHTSIIEDLEERGFETDPESYEDVPSKAYITIKETKPGYQYYYWQWREGDSWANEYIGPITSESDS